MKRRAAGFTLIEVLLATTLLAAGLALAFSTLRAATATAQRGEQISQRNEHMRAVELFLRSRIGGARATSFGIDENTALPRRFEGTRDTMRFVADLPDYLGRGGPYLHELTIGDDGNRGARLDVTFTLVLAGAALPERNPRPPELLASRLQAARFRYRGLDDEGTLADWREDWTTVDRLPLQVEVTLRDADGRDWPPMVVAVPLSAGYVGVQ